MATDDKRSPPTQPAEDFYGRPKDNPREGGEPAPREGQGATPSAPREDKPREASSDDEDEDEEHAPRRELTEADEKEIRPRTGDDGKPHYHASDDADGPHPFNPSERAPGASLDDIPDGDGPRSDAGTNPLSDVYRYGHPDRKPDDRER
jgi:hypothetical protein